MIKFFRKIRQNLLSEGKTGKYFKYAIGEIVLVVIGILIALQINNWNEVRKDSIRQASYLKYLITDFSKDTLAIQNVLNYQIEDSIKISQLQEKLTSKDASLDDLLTIMIYDWNPRIGILRSFNTNTVEALVSTGDINLIDSELLNNLANLKNLQEAYISSSVPFIEFYRNSNTSVGVPAIMSVINQGPIFDQMIESVDKISLAYKFDSQLRIKRQAYRNSIRELNEILNETVTIITIIDRKLQ